MHAEICPICKGQKPHQVKSEFGPVTCHGCKGKGWVEVKDEQETSPPSDTIFVTNDTVVRTSPWLVVACKI